MVKGCGIGCAGLLGVLLIVAVVLAIWKPWAPEIEVVEPAAGGRRVTEDGLIGNFYPAPGSGRAPAILVLGGSEGGLSRGSDGMARALAAEGYSTLALSYWGAPGQVPRMEELPLETFDTALAWLGRQERVDPDRIGILGGSKGAEAALLVATRSPDVKAVVANVPSHVVWAGIDLAEIWRMVNIGSTWSLGGHPVPYVPYAQSGSQQETVELYRTSLSTQPDAEAAATIPVETSEAPMLLVCGENDTLWPSCEMARKVQTRAEIHDGPPVQVLAYPDAGHFAQGPPADPASEHYQHLADLGGTIEGNQAARQDSWPKVLTFFEKNLQG